MSIFDKLKKLKEIKDNIFNALVKKGVEVDASAPFSSYADYVESISSSGTVQTTQYKCTNLISPITQSITDFTDLEGNEDLTYIVCDKPVKGAVKKIEACIVFERISTSTSGLSLTSMLFFSDKALYDSVKTYTVFDARATKISFMGSGKNSLGNFINTSISLNTKYYYRVIFDCITGEKTYELSEDGITYTPLEKKENDTFPYYNFALGNAGVQFTLNAAYGTSSALSSTVGAYRYYLDECYIKINDELWWDKNTYELELTKQEYSDLMLQDKILSSLEMFNSDYIAKTGHTHIKTINAPEATYIPSEACRDFTILKTVNAPKLKVVDAYAFYNCKALTSINCFDNVEYIGYNAFYNTKLEGNLNLLNLKKIEDDAFNGAGITEVYFPLSKLDSINVFKYCKSLTKASMPNISILPNYTFYDCEALEEVNILNLTEIGQYTFYGCKKLRTIDLSKVETLRTQGLAGCDGLVNVDLPELTLIGPNAFQGCDNLVSVNIPKLQELDAYEFDGCINLENIDLSKITKFKNSYTFQGCTSLKKVDLSSLTSMGSNSFKNCTQNLKIWLPSTCTTVLANQASSSNVTFYTDVASASSRPSGWNSSWYGSGTVVYGATYEDFLAA